MNKRIKEYLEHMINTYIDGNEREIKKGDLINFCFEDCEKLDDNLYDEEDIIEYMMEEGEEIDTTFGIRFITMITKFSNLNKEIGIHISNGFPIKMVYNLDDWKDKPMDEGGEDNDDIVNYMSFYLAPLLDDDQVNYKK